MSSGPNESFRRPGKTRGLKAKKWPKLIFINLVGLIVWGSIVTKLFVFDFDVYLVTRFFPDFVWILQYKSVIIVALLGVICLLLAKKWHYALGDVIFVAAFPFVILFIYVPILIYKNWPVFWAFFPGIVGAIPFF